jgi:hypothetical protein
MRSTHIDLKAEQDMELQSLPRDYDHELTALRRELESALEESEHFAAEPRVQHAKKRSQATETMLSVAKQCNERLWKAQALADEYSRRVEELGQELNRLIAERRVEMQKANQAIEEASSVLDALERESREIVVNYKREIRSREEEHNARMTELRVTFEREKDLFEAELAQAIAEAQKMAIHETKAASKQQLAAQKEEKRKPQRAQQETAALQFVEAEIARLRSENQELKRLDTLASDSAGGSPRCVFAKALRKSGFYSGCGSAAPEAKRRLLSACTTAPRPAAIASQSPAPSTYSLSSNSPLRHEGPPPESVPHAAVG